jgi:hypothetical protein
MFIRLDSRFVLLLVRRRITPGSTSQNRHRGWRATGLPIACVVTAAASLVAQDITFTGARLYPMQATHLGIGGLSAQKALLSAMRRHWK